MNSCPICQSENLNSEKNYNGKTFYQCKTCGLVFTPDPSEYKIDYPDSSLWPEQEKARRCVQKSRLECLKSLKPRGRLLDVGCGRGFFLKSALEYGYQVEGVERTHAAARQASEQLDAVIHVCNVQDSLMIEGSYDIITLWEVLEYFSNPLEALKNVKALLEPDGILVLETLNYKKVKHSDILDAMPITPQCLFTRQSLTLMFEKAGFLTIEPLQIPYEDGGIFRQGMEKLKDTFNHSFNLAVFASLYDK